MHRCASVFGGKGGVRNKNYKGNLQQKSKTKKPSAKRYLRQWKLPTFLYRMSQK